MRKINHFLLVAIATLLHISSLKYFPHCGFSMTFFIYWFLSTSRSSNFTSLVFVFKSFCASNAYLGSLVYGLRLNASCMNQWEENDRRATTDSSKFSIGKLKEKNLSSHEDLGELNKYVTIKSAHERLSSSPESSLYILYSLLGLIQEDSKTR